MDDVEKEGKSKADTTTQQEQGPPIQAPTIEVDEVGLCFAQLFITNKTGTHPKKKQKMTDEEEPQVVFHVPMVPDYQGRTWLAPPSHLKPDQDTKSYLPKKAVHTW